MKNRIASHLPQLTQPAARFRDRFWRAGMRRQLECTGMTLVVLLSASIVGVARAESSFEILPFQGSPNPIVSKDGSTIGLTTLGNPYSAILIQSDGTEITLATGFASTVNGISADGSVVIFDDGIEHFIWQNGVVSTIPYLPPGATNAILTDLSSDGTIILGSLDTVDQGLRAFRLDLVAGVLEILGPQNPTPMQISSATAISSDGSTIVGYGPSLDGGIQAMKFDDVAGTIRLPYLVSPTHTFAAANDVDFDGDVIVGFSRSDLGPEVVRWENEILQPLGFEGHAEAVSGDGSRVVGDTCLLGPPYYCASYWDRDAFYWTPEIGVQTLQDVLENDYGLDLLGHHLVGVKDLSDDGLVLVGRSRGPNGGAFAWVARLENTVEAVVVPEPDTTLQLVFGVLALAGFGRAIIWNRT